jgi:PAS domain S-box-containing protein
MSTADLEWLSGGGELGELIRAKDWSRTPLGPAPEWPQSLRSALSICLGSRFPIVIYWGPSLVVLYNDAYAEILGKKHPHALGRPCREVWSEIWDVIAPMLQGVLATGEATWSEDQLLLLERRGYPEECYFSFSFSAVRGANGRVDGIFTAVIENTRRVLGERRLRTLRDLGRIASEARSVADVYRQTSAVLEASADDVAFALLFDAQGASVACIRAEPRGEWPLGAAESVVEGAALEGLGAGQAMVLPLLRPGGQAPEGYLVAGLSPRKRLDEPYRDFVRVAAANIAGALAAARALEESRERAAALAEIDRAKTMFFSNVSHEFRTPLTLMLGPLDEMLHDGLPPEQRSRAETAYRNSRRLLKLVNTLLDFSRIEAGRAQASYEAVDLAPLTAELASNFAGLCEHAGLRLTIDCRALAQPVHVDRDMWEKIVLNLLSNAFKFTFDGGIEVTLAERDGMAELEVRDTGVGIAAEHLPRLFERFYRVDGTRSRTHEGSGIGLALVQELVRMHGGEMRVQSEPGRGSSFRVRIPFGTAHLPAERLGAPRTAASTATRAGVFVEEALSWIREPADTVEETRAAAARILVVDDNPDMRDYVARILGAHWRVDTATDGAEALEKLAREKFDLVLSDVMMPRMDGIALLKALKSDPRSLDIPVVLVSARAGEESRAEGVVAGADDYLVKPFTAQQLVAQVSAQLTIGRARRESARERERVRAAEEAALTLFRSAPNPVAILRGARHVIELANPAACEIWGRRHEEVIGRPLVEALPEVRGQGIEELLDGVLSSGAPYEGREMPVRLARDGGLRTVYFNFVYAPLRAAGGATEGVLVTAFDVTEQVLAREQMSALRAAAESANRTKDEFLAMLGHELRNPLSPIVSAMQLMRLRGSASTELDILERQVGNLTRLVDDLLDVSRITRGKIELRKQPMELAEAVVRALEMASDLLESRGHRIDLAQVPRHGCRIEADPQRLAQVISNLLTNAAKYSEPGSHITLRGERLGERVRLAVRDEGVGIAPEMIDRVFDLFVQQPQTLARSQGGLGLGLAIVRNIVELHGGRVTVKSAGVGMGSEFVVELPAAPGAGLTAPAPAPILARQGAQRRVLIVDDNVDAAAALGRTLAHLGHEVQTAHDAPTALRLAAAFRPEVALLDIGLPVMDGYELARRLRDAQPDGAPLHLLAISGYGLDADRRRSAAVGFRHHFVKPVDVAELVRLLGELPLRVEPRENPDVLNRASP